MQNIGAQQERVHELDSIRGIASFCVVIWHCYNSLTLDMRAQLAWFTETPLRFLLNGDAAVIVFFVLSGYVLALPYLKPDSPKYWQFCVRRLCRIYIPFAVAILGAALIYALTDRQPIPGEITLGEEIWPNALWDPRAFDPALLWKHFVMLGTMDGVMLNGPSWTLAHELRISLIFPLLIYVCMNSRLGAAAAILLLAATQVLVLTIGDFDRYPSSAVHVWQTWLVTANFVPCFMLGILLARHRQLLQAWVARRTDGQAACLWLAILMAFSVFPNYQLKQVLCMAAAGLLIVMVPVSPTARTLLRRPVLLWLGNISYSLYLVNTPILFGILFTMHPYAPLPVLMLGATLVSLGVATLMRRWVEAPAIIWGRRLTRQT